MPVDNQARAAAILSLPLAKQHPAAAARLAADASVSVEAARQVLASIPAAAAAQANNREPAFVAEMLRVRGLIDGQAHSALPRGPELTRHDRHNAAACRRERDGLSDKDHEHFHRAWNDMKRSAAA